MGAQTPRFSLPSDHPRRHASKRRGTCFHLDTGTFQAVHLKPDSPELRIKGADHKSLRANVRERHVGHKVPRENLEPMNNEFASEESRSQDQAAFLRRVAILYKCIDSEAGEQLLNQLTADQSTAVVQIAAAIGDIGSEQRRQIVSELQANAARNVPQNGRPNLGARDVPKASAQSNWCACSPVQIAQAIEQERPWIVGFVASRLETNKAIAMLEHLGPDKSSAALSAMAQMQAPSPEAEIIVGRKLIQRLQASATPKAPTSERDPLETQVTSILEKAPPSLRLAWQQAVHQPSVVAQHAGQRNSLENWNDEAARRSCEAAASLPHQNTITPELSSMDELLQLSSTLLARAFAAVESDVLSLAIAGASADFAARLNALVDEPTVARIESGIRNLSAFRIDDIDRAQQLLIQQVNVEIESRRQRDVAKAA